MTQNEFDTLKVYLEGMKTAAELVADRVSEHGQRLTGIARSLSNAQDSIRDLRNTADSQERKFDRFYEAVKKHITDDKETHDLAKEIRDFVTRDKVWKRWFAGGSMLRMWFFLTALSVAVVAGITTGDWSSLKQILSGGAE